jgi:hypothetical protein
MESWDDLDMDYVDDMKETKTTGRTFHPNLVGPGKQTSRCELHLYRTDDMEVGYRRKREDSAG